MNTRGRGTRELQRFTISIAAELVNVHQQTLRHYERLGLIEPTRGKGEIRYYSPQDIDRILQIRRLVEELGVNLAGVEVILNMREQMERLRDELESQLERQAQEHALEIRRLKEIIRRLQGDENEPGGDFDLARGVPSGRTGPA
ncbi:MAG TPA: MerR family transcriptional regulator [Chloroflexota bacterium]|nr:MerR family transcriptional regulator [Chloroflexota bacterium]